MNNIIIFLSSFSDSRRIIIFFIIAYYIHLRVYFILFFNRNHRRRFILHTNFNTQSVRHTHALINTHDGAAQKKKFFWKTKKNRMTIFTSFPRGKNTMKKFSVHNFHLVACMLFFWIEYWKYESVVSGETERCAARSHRVCWCFLNENFLTIFYSSWKYSNEWRDVVCMYVCVCARTYFIYENCFEWKTWVNLI